MRTVFIQCKAKECFEKCPPSTNVCDVGRWCVCTWLFVFGRGPPPMNTCAVHPTNQRPYPCQKCAVGSKNAQKVEKWMYLPQPEVDLCR